MDRQQRAMEGVRGFQQDAQHNVIVWMFLVLEGENASERYLKVDDAVGRFGGGGVGVRADGRHAVDGELERRGCDAVLVEYSDGAASTLVEGGRGINFAPIGTDGQFRLGRWALLLLEFAALVMLVVVKEVDCVFIVGVNLCEFEGKVFGYRRCFISTPETIALSEMTRGFGAGDQA